MRELKYIAFIATPPLIVEGINAILKQYKVISKTFIYKDIQELSSYQNKSFINLIIISSNISENEIKNINNLKNELPNINCLGIIDNNPHRDFLFNIENIIYLNDNVNTIYQNINNLLISKTPSVKNKKNNLSDRETDVLKLLVKGKKNKEIADELFISIHTVISHRKNITTKLGIKSIAAMAIYAVANNIININDNINLI